MLQVFITHGATMKCINSNRFVLFFMCIVLDAIPAFSQSVEYHLPDKVTLRIYDKSSLCYLLMPDCAFRFNPTLAEVVDVERRFYVGDKRSKWKWHRCLAYVTNSNDTIYVIQRLNNHAHFVAKKIVRDLWKNKQFIEMGSGDVFYENAVIYMINKRTLQRL